MNLGEEIINALADDGESIAQIKKWLEYINFIVSDNEIISEISNLLKQRKIEIVYPYSKKCSLAFDESHIEYYWFELTDEGRKEQQSLKLEE